MTIEEKIREYILERYNSLREFCLSSDISTSTLDSILKRGIDNASIGNVMKICRALNLSVDELGEGRLTPIKPDLYIKDLDTAIDRDRDIAVMVNDFKNRLTAYTKLTLNGQPVDKESVSTLIHAVDIGSEMLNKNLNKK